MESRNRHHVSASTNLAKARRGAREAREKGDTRRREIEKRVAEFRREKEEKNVG